MKKVKLFVVAAAILTLFSCDKNSDDPSMSSGPWGAGYIPVYPGNYWIYGHYHIDTLGNETLSNVYDSVVITGTASVGGHSYIVFMGTWMSGIDVVDTVMMIRDSLGYYVDPLGKIHFSYINFSDTLHTLVSLNNHTGDTLCELSYKMEKDPKWVTVPAGTFESLNYLGTVYTNDPNPNVPVYRYMDELYSKGTGLVLKTYYYLGSPLRFERRLVRYHVSDQSLK